MKYKILFGLFMLSLLSLPCKGMKKATAVDPFEKEKQKECLKARHHKVTPPPGTQEMSQIKIIGDPHQQPESLKWSNLISSSTPQGTKINFGNEIKTIDEKASVQISSNPFVKELVWVHTIPLPSQSQQATDTEKNVNREGETITFMGRSSLERDENEDPFLSSPPHSLSERAFETSLNELQASGITPTKKTPKEDALFHTTFFPKEKEDDLQFLEKQLENERIYVVKWDRVNTLAFRRTLQYNFFHGVPSRIA